MMNDLIVSVVLSILSGSFIGAVFTGLTTKSAIKKNNADALETYQKIANLASESDLASQKREKETRERYEAIVKRLDAEVEIRSKENQELIYTLISWAKGIGILTNQIKDLKNQPKWEIREDQFKFLDNR